MAVTAAQKMGSRYLCGEKIGKNRTLFDRLAVKMEIEADDLGFFIHSQAH